MLRVLSAAVLCASSAATQFALPFPRLETSDRIGAPIVVDLDGDARLDVVVAEDVLTETFLIDASVTVLRGDGWGDFASSTTVVTTQFQGVDSLRVGVGDVDAVGGLDVVAIDATGAVSVLFDDGAGGFVVAPSISLPGAGELRVGDLDGDGFGDLVVQVGSDVVALLGDGAGGFAQASSTPTGSVTDRALVDVDGDGLLDLFVVAGGEVALRLGDGAGAFGAAASKPVPGPPFDLGVGDVNGDGVLDAVVGYSGAPSGAALFRGRPGGGLAAALVLDGAAGPGEFGVDLAVGDLDADGFDDVVVVTDASPPAQGALRAFLGAPVGAPALATEQELHLGASHVELLDADLDGELDVLIRNGNYGLTWVRGQGDARFDATWIDRTYDMDPRDLDLADMDGDGDLDAVVQHQYVDDLTVVLENVADGEFALGGLLFPGPELTYQARAGDVDADGLPELLHVGSDVSLLSPDGLGGWATLPKPEPPGGDPSFVDVDGDGHVDLVGGALVQYGDGTGAFPTSVTYATFNRAADVIDVDADGHLDVVLVKGGEVAVAFLEPELEVVTWGATPYAWSLGAGDFDGDGNVDAAVGQGSVFLPGEAQVVVFHGDGARGVARTTTYDVGGLLVDMEAVDVDGDGQLDLVAADALTEAVAVLYGTPDGFGHVQRFVTDEADAVEVGDMNDDGIGDVVTIGRATGNVTVLRGRAPSPTSPVPGGVSGASGEPLLKLLTSFEPAGDATLRIVNAPARATGFVVLGFSELGVAFAGGVLVPTVDVAIPILADAAGAWSATVTWPAGLPGEHPMWLQAWFVDATAPAGYAASDGVAVVVP